MTAVGEAELEAVSTPAPAPAVVRRFADAGAGLSYLVLATLVLINLWLDPSRRVLASNDDDHGFFLFALAHGERVVFHGANPLFSDRLNVPDGINMMANTSVLALSMPFAPVTHFFGPALSMVLLLTLGLAGTAFAWYWVLSRHLVRSRLAAWIGGLWCGFAPGMIAHANGHLNFVSQFVVPFIVWQVLRLREPGRIVRGGVTLGLLVVLQVFINEEVLLFTALALAAFVLAYAALRPREVVAVSRRFAAALGVAAATAGVLLAYPLWFQFTGPSSYHGQPFVPDKYVTDLLAVGAYARQSLAGNGAVARALSISPTEDDTFFGLPMLILLGVAVVILWRSAAARATAIAGLTLLIVSMGTRLRVNGEVTSIPLPFGLVSHLPIIDLVSVVRFGMVAGTIVGILLALAADEIGAFRPVKGGGGAVGRGYPHRRRVAFWIGLTVAVVPVLPKPLPIVAADPLPAFIADGTYRSYLPAGRTLVTVPLPEVTTGRAGMRWAGLTNLGYESPRGYFLGPANPPLDATGSWNSPARPTSTLLWRVREYGQLPVVTDEDRQAARADLIFWRAAVVVLVPDSRNGEQLRSTVTELLGRAPRQVGGVLLWDERDLPVPPRE